MWDKTISASRSVWYGISEPLILRAERYCWRNSGEIPWEPKNPLISVYVPTHNRANLLMERALPSVLRQTYRNIEVIVCAHGCTDGTHIAVSALAARDSRVRLIRVERNKTYPPTAENHWLAGPVVPSNAALKECRGEWIARIDDDDVWTPGHLERLLRFAQRGYEFVSSAYLAERDGVETIVRGEGSPKIGGTQTWLYRSYLKFMKYNPDCWRKSWNRVNDMDLADRIRKAGVWTGYLDEVTAEVRPRPGEVTVGLQAYLRDADNKERQFRF